MLVMFPPLVSICIPTYNGETYLQEALNSILKQDFRDFEVIISDDQSTDDTLKIADNFKNNSDFSVRIYNHIPNGIGSNWNNCLKKAKGKYTKFLFQDDILYPTCISDMTRFLEENKSIALVASKRDFIVESKLNEDLTKWIQIYGDLQFQFEDKAHPLILDKTLFQLDFFLRSPLNKIGEPSVVMFRTDVLRKVGFFREDLKQILDYEFYYRILKRHKIAILNKKLVGFRIHDHQATNINRSIRIDDYEIYYKILYNEYFWLLNKDQKKKFFLKFHPVAQVAKYLIGLKNLILK